jgi:hypothetical protein
MKKFIVTIALFCNALFLSFAQGITAPSEGKTVVYFARVSGLGFAINFSYFDSSKFIGKFNGSNYLRYECEPGEHLFWARSENKDFITADLEAGKIYFIEAVPQMGFIKAGVQLAPVNPKEHGKRVEKIEKLINKKASESFSESDLEKDGKDLQDVIEKALEKYKEDLAKGKKIDRLAKDMFYEKQMDAANK